MNARLQALLDRYKAMTPQQYQELRTLGYTDAEIRLALSAKQVSLAQLIVNTQQSQRQAELLEQNGYTPAEVRQMLMAGFIPQNMQTVAAYCR